MTETAGYPYPGRELTPEGQGPEVGCIDISFVF